MYIRQTGQATGAGCIARADFEARQRAARTDETTYVVQGWRQGNGTLWQPNQRVIVFDPVCGFDNTELLVSEVTFTQDQNGAGCIARADFEARQRAARTDETTYVVQGWRQGNGTLWQPNQRVIVFDPVCGFDNTELLVSEVTFTQDQNGTLTEIRVGPPDAYLPEPEAPGARKKKKARVQEDPF
ncbi:phage baseplate assembly protein [Salmonella enterica]|uniref:phage baseplate assembly protein n=1 Tax=Salmonella enterica TaxID=28901 RepID=UPI00391F0C6C